MKDFETTGKLTISGKLLDQAKKDFSSARADTAMTLEVIKKYNDEYKYMLCPHSAVGVSAIHQAKEVNMHTVALATAHDGKFPDACRRAVDPLPSPPKELAKLWKLKTRSSSCPNDAAVVQAFVEKRIEERVAKADLAKQVKKAAVAAIVVGVAAIVAQTLMKRRR